jgi:hypothetical protein
MQPASTAAKALTTSTATAVDRNAAASTRRMCGKRLHVLQSKRQMPLKITTPASAVSGICAINELPALRKNRIAPA